MTSVISKALFKESRGGAVDIVGARLLGVEPETRSTRLVTRRPCSVAEAEALRLTWKRVPSGSRRYRNRAALAAARGLIFGHGRYA